MVLEELGVCEIVQDLCAGWVCSEAGEVGWFFMQAELTMWESSTRTVLDWPRLVPDIGFFLHCTCDSCRVTTTKSGNSVLSQNLCDPSASLLPHPHCGFALSVADNLI